MTTPGSPPPGGDWRLRKTRLRRSRNTDVIHRPDCRRATSSLPWLWAEDKTDDEVRREAVEANGLKPCRVCDPLGAKP